MTNTAIRVDNAKDLGKLAEFRSMELFNNEFFRDTEALALSPDNRHLAVGAQWNASAVLGEDGVVSWNPGSVVIVDYVAGEVKVRLPPTHQGLHAVFHLDYSFTGRYLACQDMFSIMVWDTENLDLVLKQPALMAVGGCSRFCKGGEEGLLHSANPEQVLVLKVSARQPPGQHLLSQPEDLYMVPLAIAPHGDRVAMITQDGYSERTVALFDIRTGKHEWMKEVNVSDYQQAMCFDGTGSLLALGEEGRIRICSVSSGESVAELRIERDMWACSLAFSTDGAVLASGLVRWEGYFRSDGDTDAWPVYYSVLWDWEWGAPLVRLPDVGHRLALSADGSRLAVSGEESVQVWGVGDN